MGKLKYVEKVLTHANLTAEVTELEKENRTFTRRMAAEGLVLLENDGTLPLPAGGTVALYGTGAVKTVKGGSGSGETNVRYEVSIFDGMKAAGFVIANEKQLLDYAEKEKRNRKAYVEAKKKAAGFFNIGAVSMDSMKDPYLPPMFGLLRGEACPDTAVCVYVISRTSGEQYDRKNEPDDFKLSEEESANLHWCADHYEKVVLLINAGGAMDLSAVQDLSFGAVLFVGMPGEEGGNAIADVLSGRVNPSGHLTASWPGSYDDVPCGGTFAAAGSRTEEDFYREDIFVGYRYYERFGIPVKYPFGHGLSYTSFTHALSEASVSECGLTLKALVRNTGETAGKAVLQFYVSLPEGKLLQPTAILADYGKTGLLPAGGEEACEVTIPWHYFGGFDEDTGRLVMEAGQYVVLLGFSSAEKRPVVYFDLKEDRILGEYRHICREDKQFDKLLPAGKKPAWDITGCLALEVSPEVIRPEVIRPKKHPMDRYGKKAKRLAERLTDRELSLLLVGAGTMDMLMPGKKDIDVPGGTGTSTQKLIKKGIRTINFNDGPAGMRFSSLAVVKKGADKVKMIDYPLEIMRYLPGILRMLGEGKASDGTVLYQYATGFPVGTVAAQTWNKELVQEFGRAAAREMHSFGVNVWLAPGVNIQRNPLCGRNYEYYSEDPVLTGKTAAAMVTGIQSEPGCFGTMKHFLGNNQEENRQQMNAHISERALREVYLRGFGIAVKEADARGLMTSYNRVNGVWSAVNKDTLTTVLREEWGFRGIVTTDWDDSHEGLEAERAIDAGINFLMPGAGSQSKAIEKAIKNGTLTRERVLERAVKNIQVILLCNDLIAEERAEAGNRHGGM